MDLAQKKSKTKQNKESQGKEVFIKTQRRLPSAEAVIISKYFVERNES